MTRVSLKRTMNRARVLSFDQGTCGRDDSGREGMCSPKVPKGSFTGFVTPAKQKK